MNRFDPLHAVYHPASLSRFGWPLLIVGALAATLLFFHFGVVGRAQNQLEAKEEAWKLERPKIGQLALLKTTQEDLVRFRKALPPETAFPQLISFISDLADKRSLSIPGISYQPAETEAPSVARILISFNLKGDYRDIRKFIYEIEQSSYFLIIENMVLASSPKEGEKIQLELRTAAYLHETGLGEKVRGPGTVGRK